MTVFEAMGTGLPGFASRVGGLPDMSEDGKEGLLIRPTPQALAEALSKLLASEDLRQALGTAAVAAAQRISVQTMARKFEALYEERAGRQQNFCGRGAGRRRTCCGPGWI